MLSGDEHTKTAAVAPGRSPRSAPEGRRRHVLTRPIRNLFATNLGDADQSLYTVREARVRPVRHHACDGGIDRLTGVMFVHMAFPRVGAVRLIDREIRWRSRSTPMTTNFHDINEESVRRDTDDSAAERIAAAMRLANSSVDHAPPFCISSSWVHCPRSRTRRKDRHDAAIRFLSGRNGRWAVSLASNSSVVTGSMDTLGGQAWVVPRTLPQTGGAGGW